MKQVRGKQPKRILLVEDEPLLATMYMLALQQRVKAEVYGAKTREEAERIIERVKPDLVLLDLMIPSITIQDTEQDFHHPVGLQFLAQIRKSPKTRSIKVMILSNLDADEQRKRAIDLGAEDYLLKASLQPHAIVEKVKHSLGIK
ncbi:MAG: response regulator [Candidatus Nomurabacteria bacterium]|nr:MAG: response regulator [Candidatus Nomurabacteria bacterium]